MITFTISLRTTNLKLLVRLYRYFSSILLRMSVKDLCLHPVRYVLRYTFLEGSSSELVRLPIRSLYPRDPFTEMTLSSTSCVRFCENDLTKLQ